MACSNLVVPDLGFLGGAMGIMDEEQAKLVCSERGEARKSALYDVGALVSVHIR